MQRRIAAACLASLAFAGSALGDELTFTNALGDGDWHTPANWTVVGSDPPVNRVPDDGDRAIIPSGKTAIIETSTTVDTTEVAGTIIIRGGSVVLTLENDDHNDPNCPWPSSSCSSVDDSLVDAGGSVLIGGLGGNNGIRFSVNHHRLHGGGKVVGQSTTARIDIDGGIRMTNDIAGFDAFGMVGIVGTLSINGAAGSSFDGTFVNTGYVWCNGVAIVIDAEIEDAEGARWAAGCNKELEFLRGSTSLEGDFVEFDAGWSSPAGTFIFWEDMATCGAFVHGCGGVDLDNGVNVTFSYAEYQDLSGGACEQNTGSATCLSPFVVSTTIDRGSCSN